MALPTDTRLLAALAVAIATAIIALAVALTHRRDDAYRERFGRWVVHGTPNAFGARLRTVISIAFLVIGFVLVMLERLR